MIADAVNLVDADNATKVSARALHDRGLVTITRPNGRWHARLTETGQYYYHHGRYSDSPTNALRSSRSTTPQDDTTEPGSTRPGQVKRATPHATTAITRQRRAAATRLIEELTTNRSVLVPQPDHAAEAQWRRVVDFTKRNRMLPTNTRLEKTHLPSGDLRIQLLDGHHANTRYDNLRGAPTASFPTDLDSAHPVVHALRDDTGRLAMHHSLRERCLLYLHALTEEALQRGHTILEHPIAPTTATGSPPTVDPTNPTTPDARANWTSSPTATASPWRSPRNIPRPWMPTAPAD